MTHRTLTRVVLVVVTQGLAAGCAGSSRAPMVASTVPATRSSDPTKAVLIGVTLFGVVSESTPAGTEPIEGVGVYCDSCGEFGHTWANTDANGYYSFSGDLAHGGGMWVQEGSANLLFVVKQGYGDPMGLLPQPRNGEGWREVTINGDTRFDIQLVRR